MKNFLSLAAVAVALCCNGPSFVQAIIPPENAFFDFVQEWLSARNFWTGHPVYENQKVSFERHTGLPCSDTQMDYFWNAHPPVSVLIALPIGWITDYQVAHTVWSLLTLGVFLISVAAILRELKLELSGPFLAALVVILVSSFPIWSHLVWGQLGFLLVGLLTLGWVLDRRGYELSAGIAVGLAASMKVFPAFVLCYFLFTGRWRSLLAAIATILISNGVALALFGQDALTTYINEVIPGLLGHSISYYMMSIKGTGERWGRALEAPILIGSLAKCLQLLITIGVSWKAYFSKSQAEKDQAFALAVLALPLMSPNCWSHYLVLLLFPMLWYWQHASSRVERLILIVILAIVSVPDTTLMRIQPPYFRGMTFTESLQNYGISYISVEPMTLSMLLLFGLIWKTRVSSDVEELPDKGIE